MQEMETSKEQQSKLSIGKEGNEKPVGKKTKGKKGGGRKRT